MNVIRFVSLCAVLLGLTVFTHATYALQQREEDEAIKRYLASQKSDENGAEAQRSTLADLNGDGKSEIVLVWTLMGPTYWSNTLTVFTKGVGGYKPVASLPLAGEAELASVKDGIIFLNQKVPAKNDPICCPSIKKRGKYRWAGRKILEVK